MIPKVNCPFVICNSDNVELYGVGANLRKYKCLDCKQYFYIENNDK